MNGRAYKMLYSLRAKAKRSDPSIQGNRELSEVNGTEEEDDTVNSENVVSQTQQQSQSMSFVLKQVKNTSNAEHEKSNTSISNDSTPTNLEKRGNRISDMDAGSSSTPKFVEYWVPVRLSNVQMETYCETLFSNSRVLCSSTKLHNKTQTLKNMLLSTRKCCDHPKLVDSFLYEPKKYNEIQLSSKLLLLSNILQEIGKRRLRVVVLYQTLGDPGPIHTGDILDDIIHENIGEDSFVYISEGLSKSKLQEACNTYNDKGSGKFICLMTTRACAPSIHLQSVDIVIFFNSDWDPTNDLRALQKIKIDSQLEHVKVFRLYSAFTVEEKLLMHAKQRTAPECIMKYMKQSTCHELLNWGAHYLFGKLDDFHGSSNTDDADHSFVEDVLLELSNLLPKNEEEEEISGRSDSSFIVEVEQIGGLYPRNICLLGEKEYPLMKNYSIIEEMILKPPHVFWTNILQGRKPNWNYISSQSSPRTRNGAQRSNDTNFEAPVQARASKKCKTQARKSQLQSPDKESLPPGEAAASTTRQEPILDNSSPTQPSSQDKQDSQKNVSPTCKSLEASKRTRSQVRELQELHREMERLEKQKTESLKQHQDKKLEMKMALEKEIEEISKKYEAQLQNADIAFVEEMQVVDTEYNQLLIKKSVVEAKLQIFQEINFLD